MKIPYINLSLHDQKLKENILRKVDEVLNSGQFILGKEVEEFEKKFASHCQTKYAVGVANGTDAMILVMKALGIGKGDEVITAPNSFLASASSIVLAGAQPVFADVKENMNIDPAEIEKHITKNTKAILPVHLTGRPADMKIIMEIAQKNNLHVIEDCAQAIGAEFFGKRVGSFGIAGCFSLHPLKNLSACGDGGMITTDNEELYKHLLISRNHGLRTRDECDFWSINSRLDSLQAAILNIKMNYLDSWTARRREIANLYHKNLANLPMILPFYSSDFKPVFHTYIIQTQKRDLLQKYLLDKGIETKIHYPIPIHLQKSAKHLAHKKGDFPITEKQSDTILSLPVYPELTIEQIEYICGSIRVFYGQPN